MSTLREAIRLMPECEMFHNNLGSFLQRQGKLSEAVAEYREALRLASDYELAHCGLARALAKQGNNGAAVSEYREALRLAPDLVEARCDLAILLSDRLGKTEEAIAEYREAIRVKPDSDMAYNNLAWLLTTCPDPKLRQPAEAHALAMKAVELAPTKSYCWGTLGQVRYANGQWHDAITAVHKCLELGSPNMALDWMYLSMCHWQLGQKDKARQWYDKAAAWMKDNKPDEELLRFRAEADKLLAIKREKPAASAASTQ